MEMPTEPDQVVEAAKSVLEKLLELLEVQATVKSSTELFEESGEENTASVILDVSGDDLGLLIGRRGQTLTCLQYIVRLIVAQQTQVRSPVIIDIEGYKRHRWEALRALALRVADQVRLRRTQLALEPMPAFERRIIHLALADHPDVTTESTGEGEMRKVVVIPKRRLGL